MDRKNTFSNGYTFNRIINGCWQLSAEHSLQGKIDLKDVMYAFHRLKDEGFITFDCADIYTGAEEILGMFVQELKASGRRYSDPYQIRTG